MTEENKLSHKEKKEANALSKELEELKTRLEQAKKESADLLDKLQRVSADYANFQKRSSKQIAEAVACKQEKIIKSLLPVLDNFERTLTHSESAENVEAMAKGVKIIYNEMLDIFKSHQAVQITSLNEKFDPLIHQAMLQRCEEEKADGIVLEEYQKGYKLNDRVIRPAKVVVNKLTVQQEQPPSDEQPDESTDTE